MTMNMKRALATFIIRSINIAHPCTTMSCRSTSFPDDVATLFSVRSFHEKIHRQNERYGLTTEGGVPSIAFFLVSHHRTADWWTYDNDDLNDSGS